MKCVYRKSCTYIPYMYCRAKKRLHAAQMVADVITTDHRRLSGVHHEYR